MGEDRVKESARRIVNFAHQNGCDLIIMEKLAGLIPDAERERGINRALVSWNGGHLADVDQAAWPATHGIRVVEVSLTGPANSVRVARALGAAILGRPGQPHFEIVGKMFACPSALHGQRRPQRFGQLASQILQELAEVKKLRKGVYRMTRPVQSPVDVEIERIKEAWLHGWFGYVAASHAV